MSRAPESSRLVPARLLVWISIVAWFGCGPVAPQTPGEIALEASRHYEDGQLEEAADVLRRGMIAYPEEPKLPFMLGNALFRMKRFDPAAAAYLHAAQLRPGLPDVHLNLGFARYRADQPELAAEAWEEAVHQDSTGTLSRVALALGWEAIGRHDEARALAATARKNDPNFTDLLAIDMRFTAPMRKVVYELAGLR